jgi:hypothetical protein
MLSSASHYVASTIEEKVYPIPSAVRRKLAPTARAVAMLAVFVVTRMQTVSVGSTRSIGKFLKYIVRGAATWFDEEFLQQPALLWILAGVVATNYWFFR